ncbi:hypothetical protein DBB42_03420 [Pseudomonas plecoglossicida]|uniref:Uncharacterized protein n=1 Tax=Pseudomonas plecoglossicida TaxID=70775 RepID=A0A2R7UNG0_PSEDL|nr:hypothetical protein DBB42_03420 [Pseudomonas plecoglossicida]
MSALQAHLIMVFIQLYRIRIRDRVIVEIFHFLIKRRPDSLIARMFDTQRVLFGINPLGHAQDKIERVFLQVFTVYQTSVFIGQQCLMNDQVTQTTLQPWKTITLPCRNCTPGLDTKPFGWRVFLCGAAHDFLSSLES